MISRFFLVGPQGPNFVLGCRGPQSRLATEVAATQSKARLRGLRTCLQSHAVIAL